ncbi:MAG: alcohol dehydrogenase catalytic domain-containing protein [Actinobacteria bacterium]|nr:alcohol dehydrogenase catalytic domain-containing protein [Actinomycetota bacterium]
MKAAGVCGTDIHIFYDKYPYWPPVVLGHEFSGIIERTGKNTKQFKVGDRVTAEPQQGACGVCRYCKLGLIHLCSFKRSPGWGIDGAMAEYIKLPYKLLHKLPDNISFIEGAIIEPVTTVTHAIIERGKIKPEDFVVIIGPGPMGLIAAHIAKAYGVKNIIITGINQDEKYRLKVARKLKIDYVINAKKVNLKDFIFQKTDGYGADFVIDTSGNENAINYAIDVCSKRAKLVAFGFTGKDSINIAWDKLIFNEINIITSMSSTYNSWKYTIELLEQRKISLEKIVSDVFPMSKYREAFDKVINKDRLKIVLVPDSEFEK